MVRTPDMTLPRLRSRLVQLGQPLAVPAFRKLWTAQLVSELGDWAARLALSVLVYTRTGSPALAGLATAASLLPWLGPGQLLTSVSERWPRRRVMVVSDLVRAGAFAIAALPLPIPLLLLVVFCAGLATPPFEAARSAVRPEIVPAPLFAPAVALGGITEDLTVALGYLAGGALVALLGAQTALLCNAATFALSAGLLAGLPRAAAARGKAAEGGLRRAAGALRADPLIARAVALVTAAMLTATGLTAMSAPFVLDVLERGPGTVGLLVGLTSIVSIVGTASFPLDAPAPRLLLWAGAYAAVGGGLVVTCFAMLGMTSHGRLVLAALAFAANGLLFAVIAPANVIVSPRLPGSIRASAFSLLMGMLVATEAAGATLAGLAATWAGLVPVCIALGLPALALGGWSSLSPAREPRTVAMAGAPVDQS